ncbi:MAG: T9SS type A sorting domain-containing protein, partial [Candidatus Marinimicrobia bacterium]|nr:T9SS type A sorting domain-containing protein [Candidatus Neomarinimicrobiota bacterium]
VRVDVYVTGASNLDTYEFNVNYSTSHLQFIGGAEDQPITDETNFLKKNGGSTVGFTCTASSGVVNCANSLVGDQGESTPDGNGLMASIKFKCLVDCPSNLSFGNVDWYDNTGFKDICTNIGSDASLPVELSLFTAKVEGENVLLSWITESEIENLGFLLERRIIWSVDADWNEIANFNTYPELKGKGSISQKTEYRFVDKNVQPGMTYEYLLADVNYEGKVEYHNDKTLQVTVNPDKFSLNPACPNPFNPQTTITYGIPNKSRVNLTIYDLLGREIKTIVDQEQETGYYNSIWYGKDKNGKPVPSGMYLFRIIAVSDNKTFIRTKKLVFLR